VWVRQLEALRRRNDALATGLEAALARGERLANEAAAAAARADLTQVMFRDGWSRGLLCGQRWGFV